MVANNGEVEKRLLPDTYDQALFQQKCGLLYQHVYDSYFGQGRSIYGNVA
jgi:type I restriction enzyme R subunit